MLDSMFMQYRHWNPPFYWPQSILPVQDRAYSRFAAYLEGSVEGFDAAAFRLPRPEAVPLDPQARLLLEHSWVRTLTLPITITAQN